MNRQKGARGIGRDLIPVAIKRSAIADVGRGVFVVSLNDVVAREDTHAILRDAEREYSEAVKAWGKLLDKVKANRSDPLTRWRLGDGILRFQHRLRTEHRVDPTNLLEAVSKDLGISDSAVGYILKLRREFSLAEVKSLGVNWSKVQEILNIKNKRLMRECALQVKKRRSMSDQEIREFAKKANSRHTP
jgi:hypothetical protein